MNNTLSAVIPAQAGIHATIDSLGVDGELDGNAGFDNLNIQTGNELAETPVDPGLRRDDGCVKVSLEGSVG